MSLITGKYFDVPAYEGGFEHYEYGAVPLSMNGKAAMNANLATRRRFFQSVPGSKWDEELNVVDERAERAREALKYQVRPQDLVGIVDRGRIGEDEDDEDDEAEDEVAMSVDS
jgi:hypothetical protein